MKKLRDGTLLSEENGQDRLLGALYGSAAGRLLLKPLTAPFLSRLAGRLLSTKASCVLIKPFIRRNNIDMTLFEPVEYGSYNEFFARKIRPQMRPVRQQAYRASHHARGCLYPQAYAVHHRVAP